MNPTPLDAQPVQPLQWTWISQRQSTPDAKSTSIWKFGFIAPDGGEVRVTLHQVGGSGQSDKKAAEQAQQAQQSMMMGMPPSTDPSAFAPPGQPHADVTEDSSFYVTFFTNRHPESFARWDTALSHDESLIVWVTITHGIIDFIRKAKPANVILDDLGNGKLKMVMRSVAMDAVAGNPEYEIEQTKQHHYRSLFQIKKQGLPSAFQAANSPTEEPLQTAPDQKVGQGPIQPQEPQEPTVDTSAVEQPSPAPEAPAPNPTPQDIPPQGNPMPPKEIPSMPQKGLTVEIGQDYSVSVKNPEGNAIDRYRASGPADILRWIKDKGYATSRMVIVKSEMPSKAAQKKVVVMTPNAASDVNIKPVTGSALGVAEDFVIDGAIIRMNKLIPARDAARMNNIVNAPHVKCTIESIEFQFETDRDMDFKRALVELAFNKISGTGPVPV